MSASVMLPVKQRAVLVVTSDTSLRQALSDRLTDMRWEVSAVSSGAEVMMHVERVAPEAMIVDHWLPDLDAEEFCEHIASIYSGTDLLQMDGRSLSSTRSPRRSELLHALRTVEDVHSGGSASDIPQTQPEAEVMPEAIHRSVAAPPSNPTAVRLDVSQDVRMILPEIVGDSAGMRELAAHVRLVAPHMASVLILGETGTGKELVAKAVHRLSARAGKPFVVLNCAAIPEALLEAELFGHTRGAFTGAVSSRMGRIEAAHGGTLFLDEIGEMPLALQAKMLRFLENGEIQKVGENETTRVDVRIVAATHQPLEMQAREQRFRLDLYHRLAIFPLDVPALRDRRGDIPMLVEHTLRRLGETMPRKTIHVDALQRLMTYDWPGNVRELGHMVYRAAILCGDDAMIGSDHIRLRRSPIQEKD